jgi:4-diphosphocytidyl-2-C-methyl-D-erythritol kinase
MTLEKPSPCKVNLVLNILGKRSDGFHELETVMHPVNLCDRLSLSRAKEGVELTCDNPELPCDSRNLVHKAATAFLAKSAIPEGVRIHLEKKIPMAAGLGGGSGNAAVTLLGLNELFGSPLNSTQLSGIAASLGSDIPFFLQTDPALATGRGEKIQSLGSFEVLRGKAFLLIHPGFGIATAWAYQQLAKYPDALNGKLGRAERLIKAFRARDMAGGCGEFYNSLEAPALYKYPLLELIQEFLREQGALGALMSGSGSTTFGLVSNLSTAQELERKVQARFGPLWTSSVAIP